MSDDTVPRLPPSIDWDEQLVRRLCNEATSVEGVYPSIGDALRQAATVIMRLRDRVAELETCLTGHGAAADCEDFDCICHLCENVACLCGERNNAEFDRAHMAERSLADRLASALRAVCEGGFPEVREPVLSAAVAALASFDECRAAGLVRVKVVHDWYDGPQVGLYVDQGGVWVPFGNAACGGAVCDVMEKADPSWCVDTWPEGEYVFDGRSVTPKGSAVAG